jgi:hypothetical protein
MIAAPRRRRLHLVLVVGVHDVGFGPMRMRIGNYCGIEIATREVRIHEVSHECTQLPVDRVGDEHFQPTVHLLQLGGDLRVDEPFEVQHRHGRSLRRPAVEMPPATQHTSGGRGGGGVAPTAGRIVARVRVVLSQS